MLRQGLALSAGASPQFERDQAPRATQLVCTRHQAEWGESLGSMWCYREVRALSRCEMERARGGARSWQKARAQLLQPCREGEGDLLCGWAFLAKRVDLRARLPLVCFPLALSSGVCFEQDIGGVSSCNERQEKGPPVRLSARVAFCLSACCCRISLGQAGQARSWHPSRESERWTHNRPRSEATIRPPLRSASALVCTRMHCMQSMCDSNKCRRSALAEKQSPPDRRLVAPLHSSSTWLPKGLALFSQRVMMNIEIQLCPARWSAGTMTR